MNKLKMKARAGVTLVELLVVMLIAVILAVGLLPMFKEYICKAQYNAEAVPVIATLRTKISLYQYDHGKLPENAEDKKYVSTWDYDWANSDKEKYVLAYYELNVKPDAQIDDDTKELKNAGKKPLTKNDADSGKSTYTGTNLKREHLGWTSVLDIDYQDLKGKRSRPTDYVYYNIPCDDITDSAYIIGCFGSGEGLAAGTGYAVCELNLVSAGKKYIGTFERYKAKEKSSDNKCPYLYLAYDDGAKTANGDTVYCPEKIDQNATSPDSDNGNLPNVVVTMQKAGWKFTD